MLYVSFTSIYKKKNPTPNHRHLFICASCDYTPIKIVKIFPQDLPWLAELEMVHLPVNSQVSASISFVFWNNSRIWKPNFLLHQVLPKRKP